VPTPPTGNVSARVPSGSSNPSASRRFARGVIGLDGEGTATSDSIDAKLSKGESVMTAKASNKFWPILAEMESLVGNSPNFGRGNNHFAGGFISDGGFVGRSAGGTNQGADVNRLVAEIKNMPAPVLHISTLQAKTQERNQVRVESRLG